MSNRFLTSGSGSLYDGTASLFVQSVQCANMAASTPVKTTPSGVMASSLLAIADVQGLQAALTGFVTNPLAAAVPFNLNGNSIISPSAINIAPIAGRLSYNGRELSSRGLYLFGGVQYNPITSAFNSIFGPSYRTTPSDFLAPGSGLRFTAYVSFTSAFYTTTPMGFSIQIMCGTGATTMVFQFFTPYQLLAQTDNNLCFIVDVGCISVNGLKIGWSWINSDPNLSQGPGNPNCTCVAGSGTTTGIFNPAVNNDWQIQFSATDPTQQWTTNVGRIERL